jgi:hypothetical protein
LARKKPSLDVSFEYVEGVAKNFCGKSGGIVTSETLPVPGSLTERASHFLSDVRLHVLKAIDALRIVGSFVQNSLADIQLDAVAEIIRHVSLDHAINVLRRKCKEVNVRLRKHKIRECARYCVTSRFCILGAVSRLKRVGYAVSDFSRWTAN